MKMKKVLSIAVCSAMIMGSIVSSSNVYAATTSSASAPTNVQVPALAYDDTSVVLTWEKGESYSDIVDYNVYQNGKLLGSAKENFSKHSNVTNAYFDSFYKNDKDNFHVKAQIMTYKVTGLNPDTSYSFTVKGVLKDGTETEESVPVVQKTAVVPEELNIKDYGAVDTGKILDYREKEEIIKSNTKAIQSAIDNCSEGGRVVVPDGIFATGSLYLKSNMTLELEKNAILSGSTNIDDYSLNSKNGKYFGVLNSDKNGKKLTNVRVVGDGKIEGNGWKYSNGKTHSTELINQKKDSLDPSNNTYNLPQFAKGSKDTVYDAKNEDKSLGLLAKDCIKKLVNSGKSRATAYSMRPSLVIIKNINNLYIEGITTENPANHNISFTNCTNVTMDSVKALTYNCNNGDGVEFDGSKNCNVVGCLFDTGDDSINFAAGMGESAKKKNPTEDIRIFNNFVRHGHGGAIAAGSHTGAWIQNLTAEDNVINKNEMPFRFKSVPINGGGVRNVVIRDNAVENPTKQAFVFTTEYNDNNQVISVDPASVNAQFNNIIVQNVTVRTNNVSSVPIQVACDSKDGHNNINFDNVKFMNFSKGCSIKGLKDSTFKNITFVGSNSPKEDKQWTLTDCTSVSVDK